MFEGDAITVEPYILDFDREIYGEQLTVTFEKRLRDEMKFDGLDALIAQIGADVETSREILTQLA
jgi:riboflavin kinase/FMN adenylyltransferase